MTKLTIMSAETLLATFEQTIDRVEAGESILIERDGAIVAELVPFSDERVAAVLRPVTSIDDAT